MKSLAEHLGVPDPTIKTPVGTPEPTYNTDITDLTGIEFCQGVVDSREYRASILRRILCDELAPAVECRLLDMAWGKAPQRVEHTGQDGKPIEMITEVRRVIVRVPDVEEEETQPDKVVH